MPNPNFKRALFLGDLHAPFHNKRALRAVIEAARKLKPDLIVQQGDLYDQYAFSRYGKSVNKGTALEEVKRGWVVADSMWRDLQEASPDASCVQLLGNHCVRLRKRIAEKMPELEGLFDDGYFFDFPDVVSSTNDRDPVKVTICGERVTLHHGFLSKAGDHVKYFRESCVVGHTHRGHTHFERMGKDVLWELNAGYLGDERSHVFGYGPAGHKWTLGYGYVDHNGPSFVSLS